MGYDYHPGERAVMATISTPNRNSPMATKVLPRGVKCMYQGNDLSLLPGLDAMFQEGENGVIEMTFSRQPTMAELQSIKSSFYGHGEAIPRCFSIPGSPSGVRIEFTKGVNWLTILGASLAATTLVTVGTVGYAVYRISKELPWVLPVALWGTGLFFLLRVMVKEARTRYPASS